MEVWQGPLHEIVALAVPFISLQVARGGAERRASPTAILLV